MKPVPCISFFNHSYFAVVRSLIQPVVEPVSYDGFIIIFLALFVNRFQLKNPFSASIRIFLQYQHYVFIYFSQLCLVFSFLQFSYILLFFTRSKRRGGKQNSQFPPLLSIYFFHFYGTVTIFFTAVRYMTHFFKQISVFCGFISRQISFHRF